MERKLILSEINLDTEMFMTYFDKAADLLMNKKKELEKQGWSDIYLTMKYHYDYVELKVFGMRLENDDEFNKRKKLEEQKLQKAEQKLIRDLKKYNELKNIFDPRNQL